MAGVVHQKVAIIGSDYILVLKVINNNFNLLKQNGFTFSFDDNSNLLEKYKVLNDALKKVEINKNVVSQIQFNSDFINSSFSRTECKLIIKMDIGYQRNVHSFLNRFNKI